MNTLSGWKESQAALQVSGRQQLLDPFTAEMVLIFTEKKALFLGEWETGFCSFRFIKIKFNLHLVFCSFAEFLCSLTKFQPRTTGVLCTKRHKRPIPRKSFSTWRLYVSNTCKQKIKNPKKCRLNSKKCLKTLFFVVCCYAVFFFQQTFRRRHVPLNVPGRTSPRWAATAVPLLDAVQPHLDAKAAAAANSLVLLLSLQR